MPKMLFNLSDCQAESLKQLSFATGIPVVDYVRNAIDQYLHGLPGGIAISGQLVSGTVLIVRLK